MKLISLMLGVGVFFTTGCATVKLKAPEEPMKIDITMRLDVYQHVQKDIDEIEDFVTGAGKVSDVPRIISFLDSFTATAYAEELPPEVEQAAVRRKNRRSGLIALEQRGEVGETSSGLVTVKSMGDSTVGKLVRDENDDRMIIYKEIAAKNGTLVAEIQKLYAERLQKDAPSGTPIETGKNNWRIK